MFSNFRLSRFAMPFMSDGSYRSPSLFCWLGHRGCDCIGGISRETGCSISRTRIFHFPTDVRSIRSATRRAFVHCDTDGRPSGVAMMKSRSSQSMMVLSCSSSFASYIRDSILGCFWLVSHDSISIIDFSFGTEGSNTESILSISHSVTMRCCPSMISSMLLSARLFARMIFPKK